MKAFLHHVWKVSKRILRKIAETLEVFHLLDNALKNSFYLIDIGNTWNSPCHEHTNNNWPYRLIFNSMMTAFLRMYTAEALMSVSHTTV